MVARTRELEALGGAHLQRRVVARMEDPRRAHGAAEPVEHGEIDLALAVRLQARRQVFDSHRAVQQLHAGLAHDAVAHRRRWIVVDGAKVPLAVDELATHGEVLRHAHERVVDGCVAVRVIVAHHLADDLRALRVRPGRPQPELVHRVQNAPVHGLQAVAHVGQRAPDDHRHGVVEVRRAHLLLERARLDVAAADHLSGCHRSPP